MINMDGIQYPIFIGIGAVTALPVCVVIALLAIFFPVLWPWWLAPVPVGMFAGLMVACFSK